MNIQEIKTNIKSNKQRIMAMLNWSELDYETMFFESAFDYLKKKCEIDDEYIRVLTESTGTLFWKWWKNTYNTLEQHYLNEFEAFENPDDDQREKLTKFYFILHDVEAINLFPSKMIFESIDKVISIKKSEARIKNTEVRSQKSECYAEIKKDTQSNS